MSKKQRMYKGLPLVDAAEDLDIEIKKGDISTARQKDPANCAAANAAKRLLHTEVEVHLSRIYVKDKKRWVHHAQQHFAGNHLVRSGRRV